ncbi:MAG: MarR family transcriptional regulator [Candidatus Aenigmarchaeota archaeon]|nr:MarR family transcriptional regulator [Candidatus Aenigmarchaeota archaeon]
MCDTAEIDEILKRRFNALEISKEYNVILPYTGDGLKALYTLMNGNIRDILNSLSTTVIEITEEKPVLLDRDELSKTLKFILEERYLNNIPPKAKKVLLEIVKYPEITNKSLSDILKIRRSNISSYIKDLQSSGCVYLRRKTGKDKYWSAEPKMNWFLLKPNKKGQKTVSYFR